MPATTSGSAGVSAFAAAFLAAFLDASAAILSFPAIPACSFFDLGTASSGGVPSHWKSASSTCMA